MQSTVLYIFTYNLSTFYTTLPFSNYIVEAEAWIAKNTNGYNVRSAVHVWEVVSILELGQLLTVRLVTTLCGENVSCEIANCIMC